MATLYEAFAAILETDLAETTLGYSYRKRGVLEEKWIQWQRG